MTCPMYEHYETGVITRQEFDLHRKNCLVCEQHFRDDLLLMEQIAGLKTEIKVPDMWMEIYEKLEKEKQTQPRIFPMFNHLGKTAMAVAAALLIAVCILVYQMFRVDDVSSSKLLAETELKKVIDRETEYVKAIDQLETITRIKMASMDFDLMLLYKDKLNTIDSQIDRCKTALDRNPANHHLRRYLLVALRDKRETLEEILKLDV